MINDCTSPAKQEKSKQRSPNNMGKVKIVLKSDFSESEIEALAHCLMPDILEYFNSDEGKKEFKAWKKEQKENTDQE